jgi:hypothetical protein
MTKLHAITAEPPVSLDIFERLTELCEAAKKQEISSVGIAIVYRDGSTGTCWSKAARVGLLIAAATRLQHRLLKLGDE